jgi:serine-type D-Ala-D-Ala carboxypeptidase/endopeptidase (penicillin-binding protein 4)
MRAMLFAIAAAVIVIVAFSLYHGKQHVPAAAPVPAQSPYVPYSSRFVQDGDAWTNASAAVVSGLASAAFNGGAFPPSTGVILMDARTGDLLYQHNAQMPLVPASTIKLIVTAAALAQLGPAHRFQTTIESDGAVSNGVLNGDLYIVGGGDPELQTSDLQAAARAIKASGIALIDGAVIADGSLFGDESVNKTWDPDDLEYGWAAPPSALTLDDGAVQFTISPDPSGGLASVAVDPPGAGRIVGGVRSVSEDADNTLRIDPLPDNSGYALSGQIPYGAPQKYWRSIAHPSAVTASALRSILEATGVGVTGAATSGKAAANATVLWTHRSRPLVNIIERMAYESNNHTAEQLLRTLGAQHALTGTLASGIASEKGFLNAIGVDTSRMIIADGSGLSPVNRVTAASLAVVLRSMLAGPDAYRNTRLLPRVGIDGTVAVRNLPSDVLGRVLGKDGYIEGASSLAGYVLTAHHGIVIYAFLVNDWQQGLDAIWSSEDDMLARIARM